MSAVMALVDRLNIGVSAGIVFISVWFFFVQSPSLFKRIGRKSFVPIMMHLTRLYFNAVTALNIVVAAVAHARAGGAFPPHVIAAIFALVCTLLNRFVIMPRALEAGKKSFKTNKEEANTQDVTDFAVDGAAKTGTKALHQTVVAFVLAMVAGQVAYLVLA